MSLSGRRGYSLLELLIVTGIIAILMLTVFTGYAGFRSRFKAMDKNQDKLIHKILSEGAINSNNIDEAFIKVPSATSEKK